MNPSAYLLKTLSAGKWNKIGLNKRAGVLVPLFSVFSKESSGIGDLNDLNLLIDWVRAAGNSILQLLPMNEMGANFCPYDAVSSFALEPAYLSLARLKPRPPASLIQKVRNDFTLPKKRMDYSVKDAKLKSLWEIFQRDSGVESEDLQEFVRRNN